jgi:hypothetical protein
MNWACEQNNYLKLRSLMLSRRISILPVSLMITRAWGHITPPNLRS